MTDKTDKSAPKSAIWGGRFETGPSQIMERINASVDFDRRLYAEDIAASVAHCAMLVAQGIISPADGQAIQGGLETIKGEIEAGQFTFKASLEDVHMNIEARLAELIGEAAGRLHTARSRNDQVATDFRLWVRGALDRMIAAIAQLQDALIGRAEEHAGTVMPGFTHLQPAQPVTFGHHLLAYVEMLGRDAGRAGDCRARLNESPLGAGALAGTSFPIDREMTARALGFDRPAGNSLDAVSDRDFAIEYLSTAALLAVHLSRLGDEIVLWSSRGFAFIRLPDALSTGSSMLPQKRNPDAAELVRAKSGRVIGALNTLLVVIKGLPLAYSKDMQEDKEPVFDAADSLDLCLAAMEGMVRGLAVDGDAMRAAAEQANSEALDLADWMVKNLDRPFRDAHHAAGRLVKLAEERGLRLAQLTLEDLRSVEPGMTGEALEILDLDRALSVRASFGGTAPDNVRAACGRARQRFLKTEE